MIRQRAITGLLMLMLLVQPLPAWGAEEPETNATACRERVNRELSQAQREYRSVLFGQKPAVEGGVGAVRHDEDGHAWIKTDDNEWKTAAKESKGETKTDDAIDEAADTEPRKGIFETRRSRTSDLVPALTQSFRALQCKLEVRCAIARASIAAQEETIKPEEIVVPNCMISEDEEPVEAFEECRVGTPPQMRDQQGDILTYCNRSVTDLLAREEQLLKLATEYDAAYRMTLQFAGNFDAFLGGWRWTLLGTFRQVAGLIGQFQRIPCFLSLCDETPYTPL